jgi:hypothetical protein
MNGRPKAVTRIGVLATALGAFGLATTPMDVAFYFGPSPDPLVLISSVSLRAWRVFCVVLLGVSWMSGGLGTLMLREWGRRLLLAQAAVAALLVTANNVVDEVLLHTVRDRSGELLAATLPSGHYIGLTIGLLALYAFAGAIFYTLRRPQVRAAFR